MSESILHKKEKEKAAGKKGKKEVPLPQGRRLDAERGNKATEVELSGSNKGIGKAIKRLIDSEKPKKDLRVPREDVNKAEKLAAKTKVAIKPIKTKKKR